MVVELPLQMALSAPALATGFEFTVNVAVEEVTGGLQVPLTTTQYCLPLSAVVVAGVV